MSTSTTTDIDVIRMMTTTRVQKATPPTVRPSVAGRFEVGELIGAGGMGSVWRATQMPIGRLVAFKVMTVRGDGDEQRFLRETRALGQLAHANVVAIHDAGRTDDGRPYIAMEHVDGGSLRAALDGRGRIPWADTLPIVRGICAAIAHAHALDIVHRDIKPENVMLSRSGSVQRVKVVDFGLAKPVKTRSPEQELISRPGQVVGTLAYMSPERMMCVSDDPRLDLYSLGVVWYEMLTGANPFAGLTSRDIILRIALDDPPAPSVLRPDIGIPAHVDALVMRLLHRTISERPDANELLQALTN